MLVLQSDSCSMVCLLRGWHVAWGADVRSSWQAVGYAVVFWNGPLMSTYFKCTRCSIAKPPSTRHLLEKRTKKSPMPEETTPAQSSTLKCFLQPIYFRIKRSLGQNIGLIVLWLTTPNHSPNQEHPHSGGARSGLANAAAAALVTKKSAVLGLGLSL